jgi:hypothetical protein
MRRAFVLVAVLALAACGGARQDADEPSGTFKVQVVSASFPRVQHIAQTVVLRVRVRNADTRALPVAVTVETAPPRPGLAAVAFGQNSDNTQLADTARPVWVLDKGPLGGDTAVVNTWSAGTLAPGASRELTWRLVATKAGTYTVGYRVSPGLTGKAKAAAGRTAGRFRVTISDRPVPATVGANGEVIRGGGD